MTRQVDELNPTATVAGNTFANSGGGFVRSVTLVNLGASAVWYTVDGSAPVVGAVGNVLNGVVVGSAGDEVVYDGPDVPTADVRVIADGADSLMYLRVDRKVVP